MSLDRGAPPQMAYRIRPPVLAVILEKTSLAAMARLKARWTGTGPPAIVLAAYFFPRRQGPDEDPPLEARAGQDLVHDPGVDLLEEPGDADDDGRPDLDHVRGHGFDALGVGHGRSDVEEEERGRPLEDVGQGQEGQAGVGFAEIDELGQGHDVAHEVGVAQHDALGHAGRAGRVDDGGQVPGTDRLDRPLEAPGIVGLEAPAHVLDVR